MAEDKGDGAQDTREDFTLNKADSASLRAALTSGDTDRYERFWDGLADQLRLRRESIVLPTVPDKGLIGFRAVKIPRVPDEPADEAAPSIPVEPAPEGICETDADAAQLASEASEPTAEGVDHEAQMRGSEQRANEAASGMLGGAELATLAGDLAEGMLDIFQAIHKPWDQHSQQEKRERVAQMEALSTKIVRGLVDLMAGGDQVSVKAIVDKITIGDKVAIALKLGAMPHEEQADAVLQLFDWQKKSVLIVSADASGYLSRRRELVEPDEPDLPFDPGRDPVPGESAADPQPSPPPSDDSDLADGPDGEEDAEDEGEAESGEFEPEPDGDQGGQFGD